MVDTSILLQATQAVLQGTSPKPPPDQVVQALLHAEKVFRREKISQGFDHLLGTWRLCFITGTRKTRQRAGIVLGAGRYLPALVQISLTYSPCEKDQTHDQAQDLSPPQDFKPGRVINQVSLGGLRLSLTGPTKLLSRKMILAFDFTHLSVDLLGLKGLIAQNIRGGDKTDQIFFQDKIGKQAFFVYFLIDEDLIAARGKGGGLALWGRVRNS